MNKQINYIMGAPLIAVENGYVSTTLKGEVKINRFKYIKDILLKEQATDLEVVIYLSTMSLIVPLNTNFYNIYLKLAKKYIPGIDFLDDMNSELSNDEKRDLIALKSKIFSMQIRSMRN